MKLKCEYCGNMFEDTLEKCPNCGAANKNIKRTAPKTPKTISDLHEWYHAHNLPPYETTRFFIGVDYKKPKAYGIYQDGENFIVYKNKTDGQRAVRYEGPDEAYAVNELYLKLKAEILNQKENNLNRGARTRYGGGTNYENVGKKAGSTVGFVGKLIWGFLALGSWALCWYSVVPLGLVGLGFFALSVWNKPLYDKVKKFLWPALLVSLLVMIPIANRYSSPQYFKYDNNVICRYENDYYYYDSYADDYYAYDEQYLPFDFLNNPENYSVEWDDTITDFEESDYYAENFSTSDSNSSSYSSSDSWSSWDSDSSWSSSDSWDSGSSDWDSDW